MKIQIIAPTLVIIALGLCSCNTLQSIRVPSINLLKGTQENNIEESGEVTKPANTGKNLVKKTSLENSNSSPQTNVPLLPEPITSEEPKEPKIVPPPKPEEKKSTQQENPGKQSILKPKLPSREGVLPPS